jgi:hypothetical protein
MELSLDTPLEWVESAIAVVMLFIGFCLGSFFAVKIFKLLSGIALLGVLYFVVSQIGQGFWTSWQELTGGILGIGFLLSFLLAPFTTTAEFEERITKLEKEVNPVQKSSNS